MRKHLFILLMCLSSTGTFAQYSSGTPPAIDWVQDEIFWPEQPLVYSTPPGPTSIPANLSGEDWFYTVKTRYNSLNEPLGYVCAGYVGEPAIDEAFVDAAKATYGGCGTGWENEDCSDLRMTNITGLSAPYHPIKAGIIMPAIAILDLNGNFETSNAADYITFPAPGIFWGAIPTSDGGYLAIGYSFFSSILNFSSGSLTGISPMYYNANPSYDFQQASNGGACATTWGFAKGMVVKFNANKTVAWNYTYGTATYTAGASNPAFSETAMVTDAIECSDGGFIIGGYSDAGGAWYKKISSSGAVVWSNNLTSFTFVKSIVKTIEGGNEVYYMGGDDYTGGTGGRGFVIKVDASGTVLWTSYIDGAGEDVVSSVDLSSDGNLFVSGLSSFIKYSYGYGFIYKFNTSGTSLTSFSESFPSQADDLRYSLKATSDGGCAVLSTVMRYPIGCSFTIPQGYPGGYSGPTCTPAYSRWNTDTYIAKFDASLTKIWSTTFDAETDTPGGNAADILSGCSTCGGTCPLTGWEIPNQDGDDVSRQECMFGITEAPDRGLIVTGKNSYNLDDCRLVKLECESVSSAAVYTSTTITGNQKYKTGAIETRTNYVASSTARITMEACKYILYDQVTDLSSGSVVSAQVGAYNCCNSSPGGMRSGSFSDAEPSAPINNNGNSANLLGNVTVSIYPNPNNGTFSLLLESDQSQIVSVDIIDSFGRMVTSKKGLGVSGQSQTEISLNTFGKGIYAVKLYSAGNTLVKKVVVE